MSMTDNHLSRSGPVNTPVGQPASFEVWQALVAPGDVFRHPHEVLAHPQLTSGEKHTILASWASDACALENAPGLRCLTGCRAEPVSIDVVLTALVQLDSEAAPPAKREPPRKRQRRLANLHRYVRTRRKDDDDDPPPCPAVAMPRPRMPSGAAMLEVPLGTRRIPLELRFAAA